MKEQKFHFDFADAPLEDLGGGITRRVLAHSDTLMITYWELDASAQIAPHTHPHEQISVILEGSEDFIIDGVHHVMHKGDTCIIPPNVPHQVVVKEAVRAYDIFTPCRMDMIKDEE